MCSVVWLQRVASGRILRPCRPRLPRSGMANSPATDAALCEFSEDDLFGDTFGGGAQQEGKGGNADMGMGLATTATRQTEAVIQRQGGASIAQRGMETGGAGTRPPGAPKLEAEDNQRRWWRACKDFSSDVSGTKALCRLHQKEVNAIDKMAAQKGQTQFWSEIKAVHGPLS